MGTLEITLLILAGFIAVLNVSCVLVGLIIVSTMQKDIGALLRVSQTLERSLLSQEKILSATYTTILITYQTLNMILASGGQHPMPPISNRQEFSTPDGKLQAKSFEELLEKMSQDPQWKGKARPGDDMTDLKDMFEDALENDIEEDSDNDEEE